MIMMTSYDDKAPNLLSSFEQPAIDGTQDQGMCLANDDS